MTDEENEEIVNDWLADPYAVDVQEQVELQENKEILAESIDQLPEKEKLGQFNIMKKQLCRRLACS